MKLTLKEIKIPQSPRARKLAMKYYVYRTPKSWSKKLKAMQVSTIEKMIKVIRYITLSLTMVIPVSFI